MAVYERAIHIDASLEDVWRFHTSPSGLVELTPPWVGLGVTVHADPSAEETASFSCGTELVLSIKPFGLVSLGPWIARITALEYGTDEAWFTDELINGPFNRWMHTHYFQMSGEQTRILDRVDYELPLGPLSGASGWFRPVFDMVFHYRHRRTKQHLER